MKIWRNKEEKNWLFFPFKILQNEYIKYYPKEVKKYIKIMLKSNITLKPCKNMSEFKI